MKAFFLDRDGVINESHSINTPGEFELLDGVAEAIKQLNSCNYQVYVVTNQGGVGLGYMTTKELEAIHEKMVDLIAAGGGKIVEVSACTHKPSEGCECRKPLPGMILDLARKHQIELSESFMVGDRDVDIKAGKSAQVKTIFIGEKAPSTVKPDYIFPSLKAAVDGLFNKS